MTKPRLEAEPAYENAHMVARDLLERIGELLTDMPAPGDDEHPIDWGHVGSINHVNDLLSQVVCFLTGVDEEEL
jgi:4'-phosphopantetheinyl transferase EntD